MPRRMELHDRFRPVFRYDAEGLLGPGLRNLDPDLLRLRDLVLDVAFRGADVDGDRTGSVGRGHHPLERKLARFDLEPKLGWRTRTVTSHPSWRRLNSWKKRCHSLRGTSRLAMGTS